MFPILSIIIWLPLLGGIAILCIPKEQVSAIRWTALAVAWMDFLLAMALVLAYFLVCSWGGERRIYAAIKFVLFTSVGSLLMLAGVIAIGYYYQKATGNGYTLELANLLNSRLDSTAQVWLLLAFAAAFAVKVPLVPFHSWLPDAYSEPPTPVTPSLAGAMSKTGADVLLRIY